MDGVVQQPAVETPQRFRPASQDDLAQSGERTRIRNNLAAIRVVKHLDSEQRPATADDQRRLARWSGWGAVPKVFDHEVTEFAAERAELLELLSAEEYKRARTSTLNAHYTDAAIVQEVWRGMRDLGFNGGTVLEPGCGSGNFIGFAPDTVTPTHMIGVEWDPTTAAIARHLYPDAQILTESFAETVAPPASFDAAIGNVPFGDFWLNDPRWNPTQQSIHNHFIAKSLDLVKPGGVVAVITSHWTLDSQDPSFRESLAARADLVGAIRLPRSAHQTAAGTQVVTDLLFLRRREAGRDNDGIPWTDTTALDSPGQGRVHVNQYFVDHPRNVIGEMTVRKGRFGPELDVTATTASATNDLPVAVNRITAQARDRQQTLPPAADGRERLILEPAAIARQEGLMEVDDNDRLTQIVDGRRVEIDPPYTGQRQELFSLLRLRDTFLELVELERTRPLNDEHVEEVRASLNARYDAYVEAHGPINRFRYASNGRRTYPRLGGLKQDRYSSRVRSLENYDPDTGVARKVDIFRRRTIALPEQPQKAENAADALAICIDRYGEVRLEEIQRLLDASTHEEARRALGVLVFDEPHTDRLVPAAEYLSGHVRAKLREAEEAAARAGDDRYAANIDALRDALPPPLGPEEIEPGLGAPWIGAEDVQKFAQEILEDPRVRVQHLGGSMWSVEGGATTSVTSSSTWGTEHVPAQALLQALLEKKPIRVHNNGVLDTQATDEALAKAEEITERFASWVWEDPERAQRLLAVFNEQHNSLVLRSYDENYLSLPGLSQHFTLRDHQRSAVARVLAERSALIAHGVGAGKTRAIIVSIMEMRRLGQARKPAMVVPGHLTEQVTREFTELYPQARVLVADKSSMSRDYRARFLDTVATGDWDCVVFTHEQWKRIPLSSKTFQQYVDRRLAQFEEWIASAQQNDSSRASIKRLEKTKTQMEERYEHIGSKADTRSGTLESSGIDTVFFDEAHVLKNAMIISAIQDAANDDPSWMAEDMMMKSDFLSQKGGKVVFATATPVANAVGEAYVMTRFLRPDLLHEAGIDDFDTWASMHGKIVTEIEMTPDGGFQQKERFASFANVAEFKRILHTFADVKHSQDLGLDLPEVLRPSHNDSREQVEGRETVAVPASVRLMDFMPDLGRRIEAIKSGNPDKRWSKAQGSERRDNRLWVFNDGRLAAMDLRLIGEEPAEHTKIMSVAEKVHEIWHVHKDDRYTDPGTGEPESRSGSLQLVFCDLATPSKKDASKYDAYEDLREQLVAKGVPREQVRFIHEADNDKEKAELFESCRNGRTQVLVGSTTKMGTGTNVQQRAVALHHVDCPWRPVDIEQREGRVIRQGNRNAAVRILAYVTEGSFDSWMWQAALRKVKFIDQLMKRGLDVREIGEISSDAMSFAEIQAYASDNPLIMEKAINDAELQRLLRLRRGHANTQRILKHTITSGRAQIADATAALEVYDAALARRTETKGAAFTMMVDGREYRERTKAADALRARLAERVEAARVNRAMSTEGVSFPLGEIGGFTVSGHVHRDFMGAVVTTVRFDDLPGNIKDPLRYGVTPRPVTTFRTISDLSSDSGHGLVMRLENAIRDLDSSRGEAEQAVPRIQAEIQRAEANVGQPFAHQDMLEAAQAEKARIRDAMNQTNKVAPAASGTGDQEELSAPSPQALSASPSDHATAPEVPPRVRETAAGDESPRQGASPSEEHDGSVHHVAAPTVQGPPDEVPQPPQREQELGRTTTADPHRPPREPAAPHPHEESSTPGTSTNAPATGTADPSDERPTDPLETGQIILGAMKTNRMVNDTPFAVSRRRALKEAIDYLVDAERPEDALNLINEANRVDVAGAWGRETHRGHLVWSGDQAEQRALNEPVIRIEHQRNNTVVRGTQKDDMQVRQVLKDLKFQWSRRHGFWYLMRKLNAPEQRRRVNELLGRLDTLGRDRIAEPLWQEINERSHDHERSNSHAVIEQTRPSVEEIVRQAHDDGRYRRAIVAIDETHGALEKGGHFQPGDAPGTGDRPPFATEREELCRHARERARELKTTSRPLMHDQTLENLRRLQPIFEQIAAATPPEDATDTWLENVRVDVQKRIERAESEASDKRPVDQGEEVQQVSTVEEQQPSVEISESRESHAPSIGGHPPRNQDSSRLDAPGGAVQQPEPDHSAGAVNTASDGQEGRTEQPVAPSEGPSLSDPDKRPEVEKWRPRAALYARLARKGAYRAAFKRFEDLREEMLREGDIAGDEVPFPELRQELVDEARERVRLYEERLDALNAAPSLQNAVEAKGLVGEMVDSLPLEDASDDDARRLIREADDAVARASEAGSDPGSPTPEASFEPGVTSTQGEPELENREADGDTTISDGQEAGPESAAGSNTGPEPNTSEQIAAIRGEVEARVIDEQIAEIRAALEARVRDAEERAQEAPRAVTEAEDRAAAAERETQAQIHTTQHNTDAQVRDAVERAEQAERQAETVREDLTRLRSEYDARVQEVQAWAENEVQQAQRFEGAAVDQVDLAQRAAEQAQRAAEQAQQRADETHAQIAAIRAEAEERVRAAEERARAAEENATTSAPAGAERADADEPPIGVEELPEDDLDMEGDTEEIDASLPPGAYPQPQPRRSSIDISGAQPYRHREDAERATWWIDQRGLQPWKDSATATELHGGSSLPPDDYIALEHVLTAITEHGVSDGAGPAAIRFTDLGGAAAEVAERVTLDRQHLAQLADYAAHHVDRLKATREYNYARDHGVSSSDLARMDAMASALRYALKEEAEKVSLGIGVIANRWATTVTGHQLRGSTAPQEDMLQLRHAWTEVASGGLSGGPGPTSRRFERLAECARAVNERLSADTEKLSRVADWSHRHASRLEATRVAHTTSAPTERVAAPAAEKPHAQTVGAGVAL